MRTTRSLWFLAALVMQVSSASGADPCTPKQLAVLKNLQPKLRNCQRASGTTLSLPMTTDLTAAQRAKVCASSHCEDLFAAVEDLNLPRCDMMHNQTNVRLDHGVFKLTAVCDGKSSHLPSSSGSRALTRSKTTPMSLTTAPSTTSLASTDSVARSIGTAHKMTTVVTKALPTSPGSASEDNDGAKKTVTMLVAKPDMNMSSEVTSRALDAAKKPPIPTIAHTGMTSLSGSASGANDGAKYHVIPAIAHTGTATSSGSASGVNDVAKKTTPTLVEKPGSSLSAKNPINPTIAHTGLASSSGANDGAKYHVIPAIAHTGTATSSGSASGVNDVAKKTTPTLVEKPGLSLSAKNPINPAIAHTGLASSSGSGAGNSSGTHTITHKMLLMRSRLSSASGSGGSGGSGGSLTGTKRKHKTLLLRSTSGSASGSFVGLKTKPHLMSASQSQSHSASGSSADTKKFPTITKPSKKTESMPSRKPLHKSSAVSTNSTPMALLTTVLRIVGVVVVVVVAA